MSVQAMEDWFSQKIKLLCDPYFDREFFTNYIHCLDRKKTLREIFEASLMEFNKTPQFSEEMDRALLHLFYGFQASQYLRESYQNLPLAQGLYTASLYRSDGRKPIEPKALKPVVGRGSSFEEFEEMMNPGARRVISYERAWESFIFLLQNRSSRPRTIELVLRWAVESYDRLTAELLTKALDICFSNAWKNIDVYLYRAFARLWEQKLEEQGAQSLRQAKSLMESSQLSFNPGRGVDWIDEWSEELWFRVSKQGPESAWEWMGELAKKSASLDQMSSCIQLLFGRCFYAMNPEQWSYLSELCVYVDSLQSASRWMPERRALYMAASLVELCRAAQLCAREIPERPTGNSVREKFSADLVKNQLVLRLDDAVETGASEKALDLAAILIRDRGMSHSLCDRLVLMASKQDGWSYGFYSIPVAMFFANTYEAAIRLGIPTEVYRDAVYGLVRLFLVQREISLAQVKKRGNYGDGGLQSSQFDVSGGARIVDRYVFNQLRNAQRIFLWPTEGKG